MKNSLIALLACSYALLSPLGALAAPPSGLVAITEVLPNALNESTGEVVELYNTGQAPVDLALWKLKDQSGLVQDLVPFTGSLPFGKGGMTLESGQVALVLDKDYASEYNSALVALDTSEQILVLTTISGNLSLANGGDGLTLMQPDGAPSDEVAWTTDPGSEQSLARKILATTSLSDYAVAVRSFGFVEQEEAPAVRPLLEISELLPNPVSGEEFIEVRNGGESTANLGEIRVRDASNKTFNLTGKLAPGEFLVVYKSLTGISLNNDGDTLSLEWLPDGDVLAETTYATAPAGQSWSLFNSGYAWTTEPTPGAQNVLSVPSSEDTSPETEPQEDEATLLVVDSLAELAGMAEGSRIKVDGQVAALPGTFYQDALHLVDGSAGIVIKLDNSAQKLTLGQAVTVEGTLDTYSGLPRVTAEVVEPGEMSALDAQEVQIGEINKSHVGSLVRVSGDVTTRSGKSFRIGETGDGAQSLLVSVRKGSGISSPAPKKGTKVVVTGIVLSSGGKLVLAPRSATDITDPTGKPVSGSSKTLLKTGPVSAELLILAAVVALGLSIVWHVGRGALRPAGRSGRSKSFRGRACQ